MVRRLHPISIVVLLVGIALAVVGTVLAIIFGTEKSCSPNPCPTTSTPTTQCTASLFSIRTGIQPTIANWTDDLSNPSSEAFQITSKTVASAIQQSLQPVANSGSSSFLFIQRDQSTNNQVEIMINRFEKAADGTLIAYASGAVATTDIKTTPTSTVIQSQLQNATTVTDSAQGTANPTADIDPLQYCSSPDLNITCPITTASSTSAPLLTTQTLSTCPTTTPTPCNCPTLPATTSASSRITYITKAPTASSPTTTAASTTTFAPTTSATIFTPCPSTISPSSTTTGPVGPSGSTSQSTSPSTVTVPEAPTTTFTSATHSSSPLPTSTISTPQSGTTAGGASTTAGTPSQPTTSASSTTSFTTANSPVSATTKLETTPSTAFSSSSVTSASSLTPTSPAVSETISTGATSQISSTQAMTTNFASTATSTTVALSTENTARSETSSLGTSTSSFSSSATSSAPSSQTTTTITSGATSTSAFSSEASSFSSSTASPTSTTEQISSQAMTTNFVSTVTSTVAAPSTVQTSILESTVISSTFATTTLLTTTVPTTVGTTQLTTSSCPSGVFAFSGDIAVVFDSTYTDTFNATSLAMQDFIENHLLTYGNYNFAQTTRILLAPYPSSSQLISSSAFANQQNLQSIIDAIFSSIRIRESISPETYANPNINDGLEFVYNTTNNRNVSAIILIGMNDSLVAEAKNTVQLLVGKGYEIFTVSLNRPGNYTDLAYPSNSSYTVTDSTNNTQTDYVSQAIGDYLYHQSSSCVPGASSIRPPPTTTPGTTGSTLSTMAPTTTPQCLYAFFDLNIAVVWEASNLAESTNMSALFMENSLLPRIMSNLQSAPLTSWNAVYALLGIFPFPQTTTRMNYGGNFGSMNNSGLANSIIKATYLTSSAYPSSDINGGLQYAEDQFNKLADEKPNAIILLANSDNGKADANETANKLKEAGTLIFAVSVNSENGLKFNIDELGTNSTTKGYLDFNNFDAITKSIVSALGSIPKSIKCCSTEVQGKIENPECQFLNP